MFTALWAVNKLNEISPPPECSHGYRTDVMGCVSIRSCLKDIKHAILLYFSSTVVKRNNVNILYFFRCFNWRMLNTFQSGRGVFVLEQVPVRTVHVCVHVLMVFSGDLTSLWASPPPPLSSDVVKVTVLL